MTERIAIIAAMPGELMPFVRGWHHERRDRVDVWTRKHEGSEWIAACAGAGQDAARRALAAAEQDGRADQIISVGWVGALAEDCRPASVHRVSRIVDAGTGEQYGAEAPGCDCILVTAARVVDEAEKRRLGRTYSALIVDMEAAALARLAEARGVPFVCIKGVSDELTARLPDLNRFLAADGRLQLAKFILFAALRPWYWPALLRMGENSRKAALGIAQSLHELLDGRSHPRKRNGYPNLNV